MDMNENGRSFGDLSPSSDDGGGQWAVRQEESLTSGRKLSFATADFYFRIDYADVESAGTGAVALRRFLKDRDIDPETVRKIGISTYEAEANVVIHSTGTGHIYGFIDTGEIIVVILDNGIGIENLDNAMTEGYSTASDEVRNRGFGAGMGIPNMKRYSDRFAMTSERRLGTRVELYFHCI